MPVDVNKLCHELYNSEKNIKGIIKKDIVPVIGCTGAGKSTLINFLQGRDLTKKKKGAKVSVFAPDAPGYPSIGESALASETAYPGGYEVKDKDYLLCDTAGYLDTHSAEKSLSIPYANFLATQYADTVKGVIILINFPSLFYNRADNFKKLSEIINTTFKNGAKDKVFSDSTLFLFNRPRSTEGDCLTKDEVIEALESIKNEADNSPKEKDLALFLGKVLANHDKVICTHILLDNAQPDEAAREAIFTGIDNFQNIPKSAFDMGLTSEQFSEILGALVTNAHHFIDNHKRYHHSKEALDVNLSSIEDNNARIMELKDLNEKYDQKGLDLSDMIAAEERLLEQYKTIYQEKEIAHKTKEKLARNAEGACIKAKNVVDGIKPFTKKWDDGIFGGGGSETRYPEPQTTNAYNALSEAQIQENNAKRDEVLSKEALERAKNTYDKSNDRLKKLSQSKEITKKEVEEIKDNNNKEIKLREKDNEILDLRIIEHKALQNQAAHKLAELNEVSEQLKRVNDLFLHDYADKATDAVKNALEIIHEFIARYNLDYQDILAFAQNSNDTSGAYYSNANFFGGAFFSGQGSRGGFASEPQQDNPDNDAPSAAV